MANLVRYYLRHGVATAGYDRSPSALTAQLEQEGARLTFEDDETSIPEAFRNPADTLVVYTPAVPESNRVLSYFRSNGFDVIKRAALLGRITRDTDAICVAGSHGKTTTSSMTANILRESACGCTAFLGGVLRNIDSNLVLNEKSRISVVEADEYDRSFHHLSPHIAIVTSTDPDHLDIYGDEDHYLEAFGIFTSLIREGGTLLIHTGLKMRPDTKPGVRIMTYSGGSEGDWHAEDIKIGGGRIIFTLCGPDGLRIEDMSPGVPVEINIDNAVAAAAASLTAGATPEEVRRGLAGFKGAKRRFEVWLDGTERKNGPVLIDDYAHSPNEIRASIASVRKLYPGKRLSVVFQPHLYTRTRDFADGFARALSLADRVWLLPIYPAREEPIPGVDSEMILSGVTCENKELIPYDGLINKIKSANFDILLTAGAGDIANLLPGIAAAAAETAKKN